MTSSDDTEPAHSVASTPRGRTKKHKTRQTKDKGTSIHEGDDSPRNPSTPEDKAKRQCDSSTPVENSIHATISKKWSRQHGSNNTSAKSNNEQAKSSVVSPCSDTSTTLAPDDNSRPPVVTQLSQQRDPDNLLKRILAATSASNKTPLASAMKFLISNPQLLSLVAELDKSPVSDQHQAGSCHDKSDLHGLISHTRNNTSTQVDSPLPKPTVPFTDGHHLDANHVIANNLDVHDHAQDIDKLFALATGAKNNPDVLKLKTTTSSLQFNPQRLKDLRNSMCLIISPLKKFLLTVAIALTALFGHTIVNVVQMEHS